MATNAISSTLPAVTPRRADLPFPRIGQAPRRASSAGRRATWVAALALTGLIGLPTTATAGSTYDLAFPDGTMQSVNENIGVVMLQIDLVGAGCVGWANVAWDATIELDDAEGDDIGSLAPPGVIFSEINDSATINIPIIDDTVFESNEYFDLVMRPAMPGISDVVNCVEPGGTILPTFGEYRVTFEIVDNETPPNQRIFVNDIFVNEADGTAVFDVVMADPPAAPFTASVDVFTFENTALAGSDYVAVPTTTLIFDLGNLSHQVPVTLIDDNIGEDVEEFYLKVENPSNTTIDTPFAIGQITDDDVPIELVVKSTSVLEGDMGSPNVEVYVEMKNGPANVGVAADWGVLDGTALQNDNDYLPAGGTVTFPIGSTSEKVLIPVVGDTKPEVDEIFYVEIFNPTNAVITVDQAEVKIINDDGAVGEFVITDPSVDEDGGGEGAPIASFAVTLQPFGAPSPGGEGSRGSEKGPIRINYVTENVTATQGEDYEFRAGILEFSELGETQFIDVPILDDGIFEGDETFIVRLKTPVGASIGKEIGTATILDDDAQQPMLRIEDGEATEGDEGTSNLSFQLTLDPASTQTVTVDWKTQDGSATAEDQDYRSAEGTVTFPPGVSRQTLDIEIIGDLRTEDDETFDIVLGDATNAVLADDLATGTILNDDEDLPSLSIGDTTVTEGDAGPTQATLSVVLAAAVDSEVRVDYATADGTATVGNDYQERSGTLVFAAGETQKTVTVPVRGDTEAEDDETFTVQLSSPVGAAIEDGEGTVTILDDDGDGGLPTLTVNDVVVTEGDEGTTLATFTVSVDTLSKSLISVDYRTVDGTALVADGDYEPVSGRLQFDSNQGQASIEVPVFGDQRDEDDEFFEIELSLPDGAVISRARGRCLIRDDDGGGPGGNASFVRLLPAPSVTEGAGPATIVAERIGASATPARAVITTAAGSAQAGADFQATTQTVEWGPGQTGPREISVPIVDDRAEEGDERFVVGITEIQGAQAGAPQEVVVVVIDNDSPMQLEAVGETELDAEVRSELDLQVRVSTDEGQPVEGALLLWSAQGRARIAGEPEARSDGDGLATQTVIFDEQPGPAQVTARLAGTDLTATFEIRVRGNLMGTVGDGDGGGEGGVADVIDESCADATGQFEQLCEYIFGLDDPADQQEAVRQLVPRNALSQARAALRAPKGQIRNLGTRLNNLRSGVTQSALGQFALSIKGDSLSLGPLQEALATYTPEGSDFERQLASAVAEARAENETHVLAEDPRFEDDTTDSELDEALDAYDATESPWGFFLNGHASFGDAPRRGEETGYELSTQGLSAGVDYRVSDNFVVGAALGYLRSDNDIDNNLGSVDIEGTSLSLYGTWYRENFYFDTVLSYGTNSYEIERIVELPVGLLGQNRFVAEGDPDSDQLGVHVAVGYDTVVGKALNLGGFVRASYVEAEVDAYTETGALFFDLAFEAQTIESLLGEVGVEISYPWSFSWGVAQPLLRVAWLHEFEDDLQVIRARLLRDPAARTFRLESERPDTDYLNVALGVSFTLPKSWAAFFQYDTDLERDDLDIHTLSGGFRFQF